MGGIAGENDGTITNCWVSADVSSNWRESGSAYNPLGAFRAYFQLKGITVGDQETSETTVKNIVLDFGDGAIATGIVNAEANSSLFLPSSLSEWYDLQGRQLNGKPTQNGRYINNGKKIFIK